MATKDPGKIENAEIPSGDEKPATDVRSALRSAIKEVEENDEGEVSLEAKKDENVRERRASKTDKEEPEDIKLDKKEAKRSRERVSKDSGAEVNKEDNESGDKQEEISSDEDNKEEKEKKLEAVGYWKTKGKAAWEKIDKDTQQAILAREQEVSQGFAQVSQRLKSLEEVEKVLAPRAQTIQQFGVSQAQVIDRLFQWMEALGHPNPAIKSQALKGLAQNFGIDVNQLTPNQQQESNEEVSPNEPPAWAQQFIQQTQSEVGTLKQTLDSQKQAAADAFVANWARDKKYYSQVNQLMGQLLQSGAVPLKDGQVDLDGAYEAAIKINPQVAAQIQQEAAEKTKADAKAKSAADAKSRAERLASAKRAGAGLKPSAPYSPVGTPSNLNGKNKPTSVRDSLRAALEEARE